MCARARARVCVYLFETEKLFVPHLPLLRLLAIAVIPQFDKDVKLHWIIVTSSITIQVDC